jgi:hypothetical protein
MRPSGDGRGTTIISILVFVLIFISDPGDVENLPGHIIEDYPVLSPGLREMRPERTAPERAALAVHETSQSLAM